MSLSNFFSNREVVELYPDLRQGIIKRLLECFSQIKSGKVYRTAFWIVAQYTDSPDDIDGVFTTIREVLGDLPLVPEEVTETRPVTRSRR